MNKAEEVIVLGDLNIDMLDDKKLLQTLITKSHFRAHML